MQIIITLFLPIRLAGTASVSRILRRILPRLVSARTSIWVFLPSSADLMKSWPTPRSTYSLPDLTKILQRLVKRLSSSTTGVNSFLGGSSLSSSTAPSEVDGPAVGGAETLAKLKGVELVVVDVELLVEPKPPKLKPVEDEAGTEPNENADDEAGFVVDEDAAEDPNENVEDGAAEVVAVLSDGFDVPKLGIWKTDDDLVASELGAPNAIFGVNSDGFEDVAADANV